PVRTRSASRSWTAGSTASRRAPGGTSAASSRVRTWQRLRPHKGTLLTVVLDGGPGAMVAVACGRVPLHLAQAAYFGDDQVHEVWRRQALERWRRLVAQVVSLDDVDQVPGRQRGELIAQHP